MRRYISAIIVIVVTVWCLFSAQSQLSLLNGRTDASAIQVSQVNVQAQTTLQIGMLIALSVIAVTLLVRDASRDKSTADSKTPPTKSPDPVTSTSE